MPCLITCRRCDQNIIKVSITVSHPYLIPYFNTTRYFTIITIIIIIKHYNTLNQNVSSSLCNN